MEERGAYGEGSILSHLTRLAVPMMLAELVQICYNIVDRIYIGHIPDSGTIALSGVGIAFPVITLINAFAGVCGTGGAPLCSIERGRKEDGKAQAVMENACSLLVVTGIALTLVLLAVRKPVLSVFGADSQTMPYADSYLSIYLLGTVAVMVSLGMNPFLTMLGRSVAGMLTVTIGAALNIILDPIFIFALDMGVCGAAVATVISQACSACWVFAALRSPKSPLHLTRFRLEPGTTRSIIALGAPGFAFKATNSLTQAVANITLRTFGGPLGTWYIGSMAIINSLREIISLPGTSFANSAQPVMGYNYGARKYTRVRRTILTMGAVSFALNTLAWLLVQTFPRAIVSVFTADERLQTICIPCLRTYFAVFFLMSCQTMGQNTFVALNCPKRAVCFSLLRKVVLVVPLTLLLPRIGMGVMGVFTAEAVSQGVGATLCVLAMYLTVYRKLRRQPDGTPLKV